MEGSPKGALHGGEKQLTNGKIHLGRRDASASRVRAGIALRRRRRKVRISALVHSWSRSSRPHAQALSLARSTSSLLVYHLGLALGLPSVIPGEVRLSSDLVLDFRDEIAENGSEEGDILGVARNDVAESVIVHDCAARIADIEKGDS